MIKIEAIIDHSKMEEVKNALTKIGIQQVTISKVDEFGRKEAHTVYFAHENFPA
jgi:nitrogen regulatory protein P-II 1